MRGRIFTESKITLSEKGGANEKRNCPDRRIRHTPLRRTECSRRSATISGTLYDTGWGFPAFVSKGKTKVAVELIEIPIRDWADVDRLEGYPRLYDRVLTDFRLPDGSTVQAWIYTINHLPEQAEVIPSGDWKVR